jgi:hypothetical protein
LKNYGSLSIHIINQTSHRSLEEGARAGRKLHLHKEKKKMKKENRKKTRKSK